MALIRTGGGVSSLPTGFIGLMDTTTVSNTVGVGSATITTSCRGIVVTNGKGSVTFADPNNSYYTKIYADGSKGNTESPSTGTISTNDCVTLLIACSKSTGTTITYSAT